MFTVEERGSIRAAILERARGDPRVVAAAEVGGSAQGGDRWSDIDLTFALGDGSAVDEVLADWTAALGDELGAVHLFDLAAGAAVYRVFLMPGSLQVDLSFAPAAEWGARGPRFSLLWGEQAELPPPAEPAPEHLLGLAAHHAVRSLVYIERGRVWQAAYWLEHAREEALALACRLQGLPSLYGRGLDRLPADLLEPFEAAFPRSLDPPELRRALVAALAGLRRVSAGVSPAVDERLAELEASARHQ